MVVAESGDSLARALLDGTVDDSTRLFVRADVAAHPAAAERRSSVVYHGRFDTIGTEVRVGESLRLQVQSYAVSEFLTIVGPTLVRIVDADDLATLVADAEACAADGAFPDFLTNPAVQVADIPALSGDGRAQSGPTNRLWLGEDGAVSISPWGTPLNTSEGMSGLQKSWSGCNADSRLRDAVALAKAFSVDDADRIIDDPSLLQRFLRAVSAVRTLRARGMHHVRVSGFGLRINDTVALPPARSATVVVAVNGDEHFIVDTASGRTFGVTAAVASAADALLATASPEEAAEHSPRDHVAVVTAQAAAAANSALTDDATQDRLASAAILDVRVLLRQLDACGELVLPRGWNGPTSELPDGNGPFATHTLDAVVIQRGDSFEVQLPLWCQTTAHAERIQRVLRRDHPAQWAVLSSLIADHGGLEVDRVDGVG